VQCYAFLCARNLVYHNRSAETAPGNAPQLLLLHGGKRLAGRTLLTKSSSSSSSAGSTPLHCTGIACCPCFCLSSSEGWMGSRWTPWPLVAGWWWGPGTCCCAHAHAVGHSPTRHSPPAGRQHTQQLSGGTGLPVTIARAFRCDLQQTWKPAATALPAEGTHTRLEAKARNTGDATCLRI